MANYQESVQRFDTVDEAYKYFEDNGYSWKWDTLWCYINGRYSCIMGSGMVEDEHTRGPIESVVKQWLDEGKISDSEQSAIDVGAEVCEKMYDLLSKWNIVDVYFYTDTF